MSTFEFFKVRNIDTQELLLNDISSLKDNINYQKSILSQPNIGDKEWHFFAGKTKSVLDKLNLQPHRLSDVTRKIFVGLQTSADKVYVLKKLNSSSDTVTCYSKSLGSEIEIEKGLVKPFLMGKDVHRYRPVNPENVVIFPYLISSNKSELMSQAYIKENFPLGWKYLVENRKLLSERENGRMYGNEFYAYIYPKNLTEFEFPKIMTPDIAYECQFTYDTGNNYHTTTVYSLALMPDYQGNFLYLLGVLNSNVMWFFLKHTGNILRGGYFRFKTKYLQPFPIPSFETNKLSDVKIKNHIEALVEHLLDLHQRLPKTPTDKQRLQDEIAATDAHIDRMVYELYGLTDEEIRIVEGET